MKTFLSIGSGPGIGTATAERFAKEGFQIVLTSRDIAKLGERVVQLKDKGYTVSSKWADAGDLDSIIALIRETESEFGPIDVLHFNSASMHAGTIETQKSDTFVADLTINIGAALVAIQEVSRSMLDRGEGTILLTGGNLAVKPNPDYLSLGIGKAGIRNLTQAVFESFRERGVHIGMVTVSTLVKPGSAEASGVADAFWALHAEPKYLWSPEAKYPA